MLDPAVCARRASSSSTTTSRSRTGARPQRGASTEAARGDARRPASALKAATVTPEGADDVGSPNRILREEIDGKVIIRTGRRIPGVTPVAGVHYPIAVVRMAVGDAYGAKQWREARRTATRSRYRTERISRSVCRAVAEYASAPPSASTGACYGGPKWTVSPIYEGMLKEEMDAAAERHPEVPYRPVLIDATYAGLISGAADAPLVIPGAEPRRRLPVRPGHAAVRLDRGRGVGAAGVRRRLRAEVVMAEAPHGTAPALQGKDIANPMAMILAVRRGAALRRRRRARRRRPRLARDLRVHARGDGRPACARPTSAATRATTEFTDEVIARVRTKIDIWSSLVAG